MKRLIHDPALMILLAVLCPFAFGAVSAWSADASPIDGWQAFERRVRDDLISYEDSL